VRSAPLAGDFGSHRRARPVEYIILNFENITRVLRERDASFDVFESLLPFHLGIGRLRINKFRGRASRQPCPCKLDESLLAVGLRFPPLGILPYALGRNPNFLSRLTYLIAEFT